MPPDTGAFTEQKMAVVAQTEEFDYWETTLEHPYKRLAIIHIV